MDSIITDIERKEYEEALRVVKNFKEKEEKLYQLKVEAFRADLTEYFKNNKLDGIFTIKEFSLDENNGWIIPKNPTLEESYEGDNNEDIRQLCEKHGVKFKIVYWCYHK